MFGNTFGEHFRLTTFGESHGQSVGGVIDGCPAGLKVDFEHVSKELARRRGDGIPHTTARKEPDLIEWQSGIMDGVTLGTPIAFIVGNRDVRSDDYESLKDWQRAGHADYTWQVKYGVRDHRGGGRASARETVARVIGGTIAKQLLLQKGISISSEVILPHNREGENGSTRFGGHVKCTVYGLHAGVGDPVFNKLNARLAYATMSIPSAVSFEMGSGNDATSMTGAEYADRWTPDIQPRGANTQPLTITNHSGGIQGGISNGMPVEFSVGFHPVVTQIPLTQCRNLAGEVRMIELKGRHDHCHVPRAAVIVEAMAALAIIDFLI